MDISRKTAGIVGILLLIVLLSAGLALAVPQLINYQGKLVDSVGDPVNAEVNITFTIYNAPTGGDVLWTESQTVGVVNGIFNVYLGSIAQIPEDTFGTDDVYLGISINGGDELTPRQQYSAAPFAFRSHTADLVADGAVTSAMITNGTILGEDIATDTITSNEIAAGAVNTSEIAPNAVTSSEIADGTIAGTDIASETITAGNIATNAVGNSELGPLAVITENLGASSVNSNIILNNTIVDEDISDGAGISASKINTTDLNADTLDGKESTDFFDRATFDLDADNVMDSANDADTLDGLESTDFSRKYANVAVVALSGGDYTSPVDAVTDLSTWCGTPSMTNPCLIKVMPGIYDVGTNPVVLQPLLSIEGSGINATMINGTIDGTTSGVIVGVGISEIKHLSVQNYGGGTNIVTIYNNDNITNDTLRIYDVRAMAGGATRCYTIFNGDGASTEIRTVKASAECTGQNIAIFSDANSELSVEDTSVEAKGGSSNAYGFEFLSGATFFLNNVHAYADTDGSTAASGVWYVSSTGEMHNVIAEAHSFGEARGIHVDSSSDVTMRNVTATATSTSVNDYVMGIHIDGSSSEIYDVITEASGGMYPRGVQIEANSDVTMRNVTASASTMGATSPDISAIYTVQSTVDMENVSAEASTPDTSGDVYGIKTEVSSVSQQVRMKGISVDVTGGNSCYGIDAKGTNGGYMPMTDVSAWSMNGATASVGIRVVGVINGNSSDFLMKNVEAFGIGSAGINGFGILLLDNAYANMQGVEALGNGGSSNNFGIYAENSGIEGLDVKAQGEGGGTGSSYGLYMSSTGGDRASINGGQIKSYSGTTGYAVYLSGDSSVELMGVKVQAVSAADTFGIKDDGGTGEVILRDSVIEGTTDAVSLGGGYSFKAAGTGFIGPDPNVSGSKQCLNSYRDYLGSFVSLDFVTCYGGA